MYGIYKRNKELQESLISDANITTDTTTIHDTRVVTLNVDFNALIAQNKDTVRMDSSKKYEYQLSCSTSKK